MTTNICAVNAVEAKSSTQVQQMVIDLRASKQHRISPQVLASTPATARQDRPNRFFTLWNISGKEA